MAKRARDNPLPGLIPASDPRWRRCLGYCGRLFRSSWRGHRVCPACVRRQAAAVVPVVHSTSER